jgi:hypothetical protein
MKARILGLALSTLFVAGSVPALAQSDPAAPRLILTASNAVANRLLVYGADGTLLHAIATGGQGGVSGNAGGIAQRHGRVAVVNFASGSVSIFSFLPGHSAPTLAQIVPVGGSPVSVAWSEDHLYVLTTTHVESHAITEFGISDATDGTGGLVKADGSAAQVGVVTGQLVISEKSNAIETVNLDARGAVAGSAALVAGIPSNVNAPFGLATRGNDAYVTIAHANEISLVRHDQVLTVTGSGTQNAPCWLALDGPFLFSSNSPSMSVSRYAVYGEKIVQDEAVVATFNGDPTDIAYEGGLAAVVDSNGTVSHVSIFHVDEDGNFTTRATVTIDSPATNGIAIVRR